MACSNSLLCVKQERVRLARAWCSSWKNFSYKRVEEVFPFQTFIFSPLSVVLLSGLTSLKSRRMGCCFVFVFFFKNSVGGCLCRSRAGKCMSRVGGRERPGWRHRPQRLSEMWSPQEQLPSPGHHCSPGSPKHLRSPGLLAATPQRGGWGGDPEGWCCPTLLWSTSVLPHRWASGMGRQWGERQHQGPCPCPGWACCQAWSQGQALVLVADWDVEGHRRR